MLNIVKKDDIYIVSILPETDNEHNLIKEINKIKAGERELLERQRQEASITDEEYEQLIFNGFEVQR